MWLSEYLSFSLCLRSHNLVHEWIMHLLRAFQKLPTGTPEEAPGLCCPVGPNSLRLAGSSTGREVMPAGPSPAHQISSCDPKEGALAQQSRVLGSWRTTSATTQGMTLTQSFSAPPGPSHPCFKMGGIELVYQISSHLAVKDKTNEKQK